MLFGVWPISTLPHSLQDMSPPSDEARKRVTLLPIAQQCCAVVAGNLAGSSSSYFKCGSICPKQGRRMKAASPRTQFVAARLRLQLLASAKKEWC